MKPPEKFKTSIPIISRISPIENTFLFSIFFYQHCNEEHCQNLYDVKDSIDGTYKIFIPQNIFCIIYSCATVYRIHQKEKCQHSCHHNPVFILKKSLDSSHKGNIFFYFCSPVSCCSYSFFCPKEGAEKSGNRNKSKYNKCFCPCRCIVSKVFYQRQCKCIYCKCSC